MVRLGLVVLVSCVVVGCASSSSEQCSETNEETEEPAKQAEQSAQLDASAWEDAELETQPHMELLIEGTDADAGTTDWRTSERQLPETLTDPEEGDELAEPGAVLRAVAAELAAVDGLGREFSETTMRVDHHYDGATGVILVWGLRDDATVGRDYRVEMRQVDGDWHVESLDERFHCRRGVTDDGLCL